MPRFLSHTTHESGATIWASGRTFLARLGHLLTFPFRYIFTGKATL